jgi:hypothetical protein
VKFSEKSPADEGSCKAFQVNDKMSVFNSVDFLSNPKHIELLFNKMSLLKFIGQQAELTMVIIADESLNN